MPDDSGRFEFCPRCKTVTAWLPHPAGWRCSSCSLCASEFQTTLAEHR